MLFRKAVRDDVNSVSAIYEAVKGTRFCVWDDSYPGEEEINSDLAAGYLYVLEDAKEVIGAISIVPEKRDRRFPLLAGQAERPGVRPGSDKAGPAGAGPFPSAYRRRA